MKRVHGILQSLQDMKRAIGVTFLVSVAAELPHKGTRPGTETLTICEGAQGLRDMLLLPDQSGWTLRRLKWQLRVLPSSRIAQGR
ncbi:hypothetical protein WJX77_010123 [Trebouxia sp. C0004]